MGNIDADPLFDATGHLQPGSPCIDAGNRAAVPDAVKTDLDGDHRIRGAGVDMGAYESWYQAKKTNRSSPGRPGCPASEFFRFTRLKAVTLPRQR